MRHGAPPRVSVFKNKNIAPRGPCRDTAVSSRHGRETFMPTRHCRIRVHASRTATPILPCKHPYVLRMQQQQQPPPAVVAPIPAQQWAQCENPNCNKWRLLPVGAVLNENEPWYCYMNPDPDTNTCEAPEAVRILRFQSRSMY